MKVWRAIAVTGCMLVITGVSAAQTPLANTGERAVDATVGNQVLQLRYLAPSPFTSVGNSDLDFGALLTENREFVASAAWMFDTDLPIPRLRLQVGPQANLAWLATGSKTDVFALAVGAGARYELIRRLGLSAFGSAAYSPVCSPSVPLTICTISPPARKSALRAACTPWAAIAGSSSPW